MRDMPHDERSIVEEFRLVAERYVDAQAAADVYEETKTTRLEKMKDDFIKASGDPKMADNRAERSVKASAEWQEFMDNLLAARTNALRLKLNLELVRIKERQIERRSWTERVERKMGRSAT